MQHQAALTVVSLVCAFLRACCVASHAQTHDHGQVKGKVKPQAHVYHQDTRRNPHMLKLVSTHRQCGSVSALLPRHC